MKEYLFVSFVLWGNVSLAISALVALAVLLGYKLSIWGKQPFNLEKERQDWLKPSQLIYFFLASLVVTLLFSRHSLPYLPALVLCYPTSNFVGYWTARWLILSGRL